MTQLLVNILSQFFSLPLGLNLFGLSSLIEWWAILFYIVLILGVGYIWVRSYLNEQEAKQLKAVDALKTLFFTNITHELRTPLTLILAPVEQLKQRLGDADDQHQLELINQNARKLYDLIDQLMDLSKAGAKALQVDESQGDIGTFVAQLVHSFDQQAKSKGMQLTFRADKLMSLYWFDADKLERVVSNLVANALKFTPAHGKVTVSLTVETISQPDSSVGAGSAPNSWLHLEVADNGVGIVPDKLPYIFDRYYQAHNASLADELPDVGQQKGTGIGLALVKELVEIQRGTIQVVSKRSIGTTFTVYLPCRPAASVPATTQLPALPAVGLPKVSSDEYPPGEEPIILVVEDNLALSDYIANSLPASYQIHRAMNGAEGLKKAFDIIPDLVISDVMMPIMDGYTLCRWLKEDPRTSHIAFILLTARASVDSRLEGLSLGADDYINKPFHIDELRVRVRNLLDQRHQLQQWALASINNPDAQPTLPAPTDPLVEKLCQIVEQHLDETAFGAEELMAASGMSRMNLHRKLKALTGSSTSEFIRNYRLKRAAQLLRQGHTVSETAYLVGFEDPSYFTRSFRKVYNETPSVFARNNTL
ncbi:ATP-binding response regulator [Spirosoma areae]